MIKNNAYLYKPLKFGEIKDTDKYSQRVMDLKFDLIQ